MPLVIGSRFNGGPDRRLLRGGLLPDLAPDLLRPRSNDTEEPFGIYFPPNGISTPNQIGEGSALELEESTAALLPANSGRFDPRRLAIPLELTYNIRDFRLRATVTNPEASLEIDVTLPAIVEYDDEDAAGIENEELIPVTGDVEAEYPFGRFRSTVIPVPKKRNIYRQSARLSFFARSEEWTFTDFPAGEPGNPSNADLVELGYVHLEFQLEPGAEARTVNGETRYVPRIQIAIESRWGGKKTTLHCLTARTGVLDRRNGTGNTGPQPAIPDPPYVAIEDVTVLKHPVRGHLDRLAGSEEDTETAFEFSLKAAERYTDQEWAATPKEAGKREGA